MFYQPEIKAVMIPAKDYCSNYRDSEQFIEYCKVCPRYGNLWCCPPHRENTDAVLAPFKYVYLVGIRTEVPESLQDMITDPQTIGEMAEFITKDCRRFVDSVMLGLEKAIPQSMSFHAGRCYRCEYCARLFGKECNHPELMRPSLESYGFDVARTTEELLGFSLEWSNERLPKHIAFISALFTKERITL